MGIRKGTTLVQPRRAARRANETEEQWAVRMKRNEAWRKFYKSNAAYRERHTARMLKGNPRYEHAQEIARIRRLDPNGGWAAYVGTLEHRYVTLKGRANTKKFMASGRRWDLTRDQFAALVKNPCTYCGDVALEGKCLSLDRIDSNGGYVVGNVTSCCEMCNRMKMDMSLNDFRRAICNVAAAHGKFPTFDFNFEQDKRHPASFSIYVYCAKHRACEFVITEDEFRELSKLPCTYCHRPPTSGVDSSRGYTKDNVVPCCSRCNTMKLDHPVDVFLNKCNQIMCHMRWGSTDTIFGGV